MKRKQYIYRRADERREPAVIRWSSTIAEWILAICIILAILHNFWG